MPIEITIPRLGWNMEEGVFAGWLKRDGEIVRPGEPLFSLEGDKATQDVESVDPGVLKIPPGAPGAGDRVPVGAVIGYLLQPGEFDIATVLESVPEREGEAPAEPRTSSPVGSAGASPSRNPPLRDVSEIEAEKSTRSGRFSSPLQVRAGRFKEEGRMRKDRAIIRFAAGGLASGFLVAAVCAQDPAPLPPSGPAPANVPYYQRQGPIGRAMSHTKRVLTDNFIGYPQEFAEPPPGFYINEIFGVMKVKASPHRYTLYQTDFLPGADRLSPVGAGRFNLMAARLRSSLTPVMIEWSPDEPGLAEARRTAVLALLRQGGFPVIPERVLIGPSPYPGGMGSDSEIFHPNMLTRDGNAAKSYSTTPTSSGGFSSSGGSSSGGP